MLKAHIERFEAKRSWIFNGLVAHTTTCSDMQDLIFNSGDRQVDKADHFPPCTCVQGTKGVDYIGVLNCL